MGESELLQEKAEKLAQELENDIQVLSAQFNEAIQAAGFKSGLKLKTEIHVSIET